jgi:hypothetical protein
MSLRSHEREPAVTLLPGLQEVFFRSAAQLAWAQEIVRAAEDAEGFCKGTAALNGQMIDRPVIRRARDILERRDLSRETEANVAPGSVVEPLSMAALTGCWPRR